MGDILMVPIMDQEAILATVGYTAAFTEGYMVAYTEVWEVCTVGYTVAYRVGDCMAAASTEGYMVAYTEAWEVCTVASMGDCMAAVAYC